MTAEKQVPPPESPPASPATSATRTWWNRLVALGWWPFWTLLVLIWFSFFNLPPMPDQANFVVLLAVLVLLLASLLPGFLSTVRSARQKPVATAARWLVIAGIAGYAGYFLYAAKYAAAREQQGRVQWQLRQIHRAEQAHFEKHKRYGTFEEIGFKQAEEGTRRYTFRIGSGQAGSIVPGSKNDPTPDNTIVSAALSPDGQHFTATATGNLDDDAPLDQWHVTDAAEWPVHDADDLRNWWWKPR